MASLIPTLQDMVNRSEGALVHSLAPVLDKMDNRTRDRILLERSDAKLASQSLPSQSMPAVPVIFSNHTSTAPVDPGKNNTSDNIPKPKS